MLKPVTALVLAAGPGDFRPALRRLGERKAGHTAGPRCFRRQFTPRRVRQEVAAGVREDLWSGRGRHREVPGLRELAPQRRLT
jgi:hypothetical protein